MDRILEQNLQSKAYTCEISTFVSRPDEYIKYFDQGPFFAPPKLYQDMIENGANYMPSLAAALQSSLRIGDALGPWCSERMLELALHDVAQKFRYTRKRDSLIDERVDDSKEAERILRNLEAHVLTARRLGDNIVAPKHEELSPKVHALFDVLGKFKHIEKDFCAIVFCDQRWSTSVLAMAIKNWPALSWIRPGVIVGHGQGKTSLACMSVKDQYDTMTNFRTGKINLLLATCVAEEGLDIQSCNLVIRFDMFASLASYIQSRGRARHHESLFVVLSQRNNPLEAAVLTTMYAEEQKMRRALFANENGKDDTEITETAQKPKPDEIFCVESTGACVSLQSSIETLHKYCQTLPTDGYTKTQPEYTEETVSIALSEAPNAKMQNRVICRLVLPMNVPDECRVIIGRPAGNKTVARRWAALEAIQRLFYVGELDERLCPIRPEKPLQVQQEAKQAKKIEVREYVYRNPILYGQSWGETSTARLHRIYLTEKGKTKRMFSVGLLTPMDDNIPDFTFDYIQEDVQCEAHIEPIPGNIQMTSERLKVVRGFHYELFVSILRSKFTRNSDFTALLIPVNDEEALEGAEQVADWRMLFDLHSESKDTVEDLLKSGEFDKRDWKNVVLYDHVHYKRRFFIQGLHKDLQPRSTENLPRKLGKHKCIADYYTYRLGYKGEIHENQPILSAVPIGVPFLTVPATYHDRDETLVIPQFCKIHPVPATVMAYEAPRITLLLYHLHHNLLAMEVQKGWPADFFCHIEPRKRRAELPVSLSTLRPALTASCSELTFDYERLEYLGDSFLKMFLTLHFFVLNPRRHEGFLTEARRMVENNTFLRSRATLEDIQGTMMFHKMKRLDWFPPVNESMRRTQFIPNKTVADAIEAIIGACILESQEKGGAIATKRFLGSEFKDDISDYLDIWNQHMTQTDNRQRRLHAERMMRSVHLVQETIGYKFVNPRYAVEAITHASSLGPNVDGTGDCYERLEFLGMMLSSLTFILLLTSE